MERSLLAKRLIRIAQQLIDMEKVAGDADTALLAAATHIASEMRKIVEKREKSNMVQSDDSVARIMRSAMHTQMGNYMLMAEKNNPNVENSKHMLPATAPSAEEIALWNSMTDARHDTLIGKALKAAWPELFGSPSSKQAGEQRRLDVQILRTKVPGTYQVSYQVQRGPGKFETVKTETLSGEADQQHSSFTQVKLKALENAKSIAAEHGCNVIDAYGGRNYSLAD